MVHFAFEAIGTKWAIDIAGEYSSVREAELLARIKERIDAFDKKYSRFRDDSFVMEMAKHPGTFELPEDAYPMFALYRDLYMRTNGLFTPLVGDILSDAGYDADYSLLQKNQLQKAPAWDDVIAYSLSNFTLKKPVVLDFGGGGKGYLVDLVGEVLKQEGVLEFLIDAGGDILHLGKEPQKIGLEHPEYTEQVVGIYPLFNQSICGSAGNRRKWGDFTHIINPKTLVSPKNILAVWVVADSALVADALATCLFFSPASAFADAYDFEYVIVRSDFSVEKSPNFKGELFSS